MKAIVLETPGQFRHADVAKPAAPGPGEALVRVRRVGVCGTDFHAFRGEQPFFTYPRILGHELGVEVVAVGPGEHGVAAGTRCAVEPYFNCGHCPACRRGKTNCCLNLAVFGVHIDGGMREHAIVPAAKLHPAPALSFEQLALVEPLSIGAHAVARGQVADGERVLVVGAGPIGLAVIQFALLAGAQVMAMDVSERRLAFCRQQWPEVACIDGRYDPLAALQDLVADDLPTAVFDATGNAQSMMAAFGYVAHGGRLIFVGLIQGDVTFHDPDFHRRELTILGSRNATAADFQRIIGYLEEGKIDLAPWITHRASSESMIDAFPGWFDRDSGIIKAVVAFDS
jgi:2-desacetyl-2-hydroxyethyl bacteriochlorophyllide A dehydrogenase